MKILGLILLLTSCATPDLWRPEDHRREMMQCYVACRKTGMKSYDAWTAECVCNAKKYRK